MFDKNFHHHDEQVLKLSLKIFSDPSSENLQIDKIFSNFPQKEEARLLYPNYIHFLELVLNEKTHTHKAFWTAFSKSYSQQENIHTTLKVDDLVKIIKLISTEKDNDVLLEKFKQFIITNGLLRSASLRHLEYESISNKEGFGSVADLNFEINSFNSLIVKYKEILLDAYLSIHGINSKPQGFYEDSYFSVVDKSDSTYLKRIGLLKDSSHESFEQIQKYLQAGPQKYDYLKELSETDKDSIEREKFVYDSFSDQLYINTDRVESFSSEIDKLNREIFKTSEEDSAMQFNETFYEIFFDEMNNKFKDTSPFFSNFEQQKKDFFPVFFTMMFKNLSGHLYARAALLNVAEIDKEQACLLTGLSNTKTILNEASKENSILKWSVDFLYLYCDSVFKWGSDDKRKSRIKKFLYAKDLTKKIDYVYLKEVFMKYDSLEKNNDMTFRLLNNKNLGQLTADESLIINDLLSA